MRRFKILNLYIKGIYYFGIIFFIIACLVVSPDIFSGKLGMVKTIYFLMVIMFSITITIILYKYLMKMIVYIKIEGRWVQFYDLNKHTYEVSISEIKCITFKSNRYIFEIDGIKTLYAYRKIWLPFVEKEGVKHRGVLETDFIGVRIDEDYSSIV